MWCLIRDHYRYSHVKPVAHKMKIHIHNLFIWSLFSSFFSFCHKTNDTIVTIQSTDLMPPTGKFDHIHNKKKEANENYVPIKTRKRYFNWTIKKGNEKTAEKNFQSFLIVFTKKKLESRRLKKTKVLAWIGIEKKIK